MEMSKLLPSLQKYYNALHHLEQFSVRSSFFDNIGCLDVFLSEFRSVTLVLQESLGSNQDPVYLKNLNEYLLKDERVAKWLNDQRVTVIHKHPFKLKKILRVIIYDTGRAIEFKRFEQTLEEQEPIGDFEKMIRETFLSLPVPEINFSAQYLFVDEDDHQEISIFDLIEPGVIAMWRFLHAMKNDLPEESEVESMLLKTIDESVMKNPRRWLFDSLDYCYYRSTDSFERGSLISLILPEIRTKVSAFMDLAKISKAPISDFYDAFIWMHSMMYFMQKGNLMSTFFVEFNDETYLTLTFAASLRTTMYRHINRVAEMVTNGDVINVYLVTEMVSYPSLKDPKMKDFFQLNYREKEKLRQKTLLSFYKITDNGDVLPVMFDADSLIEALRTCVKKGSIRPEEEQDNGSVIMLTPIINSFKTRFQKSVPATEN